MSLLLSAKIKKLYPENKLPKTSLLIKNVLHISSWAAFEIFFIGLIGMADTIMVGRISDAALAAVSICQQPVFITIAAATAINAGVIAIISRRKGENNQKEANECMRQAIIIGALIGLLMTIMAILLARPILKLAGAQSDTIDLAVIYFRIVSSCLVLNYIRYIISAALRAIGKTKSTLMMNVAANLINVFFNYCLIYGNFGFKAYGVKGAAIATVIGNTVAFFISIGVIYHKKQFLSINIHDNWHLNPNMWAQIFKISQPAFIEQIFMRVGFFGIAMIVNNLGTTATAINTVISSIMTLSFNITDGFSIGASSLVGQSLGEKDYPKAFAYGRISQMLSIGIASCMMIIVIILCRPLSYLFSENKDLVDIASRYLVYTCVIFLPQSIQWVTTGILRGAGDVKYTARASMISIMIVRPAFSYVLCYILGFGLIGSWISMLIDQGLRAVLNNIRFLNLKWMKIEV